MEVFELIEHLEIREILIVWSSLKKLIPTLNVLNLIELLIRTFRTVWKKKQFRYWYKLYPNKMYIVLLKNIILYGILLFSPIFHIAINREAIFLFKI